MNKIQFDLIAKRLIKTPEQREALRLNLFGGLSHYKAELAIYGKATKTVGRDVKRIKEKFDFITEVAQMQELKTSAHWAKLLNIVIVDPDGWDRQHFDYSFHAELINYDDFIERKALSTCLAISPDKRG